MEEKLYSSANNPTNTAEYRHVRRSGASMAPAKLAFRMASIVTSHCTSAAVDVIILHPTSRRRAHGRRR
jgi:hypothetical protein